MQKIQITRTHVKKATQLAVGYSVKSTVKAIIKNNVPTETTLEKGSAAVGAWIIGAMVADLAKTKSDEKVDAAIDTAKKVKTKIDTHVANLNKD